MKRVGILGGGIAGLSLAYFLGPDCEVLEKEDTCGGLCRTYEVDGFFYDLGGHIMFSKDQEILDLELNLLDGNYHKLFRKNSVWFKQRLVKYPFENGLGVLDPEDKFECLYHFINNPPRPQHNFEDWIFNTFGKGLAEQYLLPYNNKIWKTNAKEMGTHWVERIPKPPVEDIIKSALGIETEGYTHQLYFYYPKSGGFQSLPIAFEKRVSNQIIRDFTIAAVQHTGGKWIVSNGKQEREYEKIVCAMPIFDFIDTLAAVPQEVRKAVDALTYNSLIVVMLGMNTKRKLDQTAIYFPQPDLLFHRVVFFDYFGSNYVPKGCSSVVAEITAKIGDPTWSLSDEKIAELVADGLDREGLIDKNTVVVRGVQRRKYAYAIYDIDREKNLEIVYSFCQQQGIELCGRFAEFVYYNSDGVVRSAKTVAEKLNREFA